MFKDETLPAGVIGLGIDTIEIGRIREILTSRTGARFEQRVFTPGEIAYCRSKPDPHPHFAARFAAKEAGMKALGTGWNAEVGWQGIEVLNEEGGKPRLKFNGKTAGFAEKFGCKSCLVSLSHDQEHAVAAVILVGGQG